MSAPGPHVSGYWRRHAAATFRWLHLYLSMVSFAVVFFFAVTGLTLNHAAWCDRFVAPPRLVRGTVAREWVAASDPAAVDRPAVVAQLRRAHGLTGALAEFAVDDAQCRISFRGPGYTADAVLDRATGAYELTETRLGLVAVLNDLHKGRDSGAAWSWVIDVSAVLLLLVSVTGMVLICFLKRRRFTGLLTVVLGALGCYLIYRCCVP